MEPAAQGRAACEGRHLLLANRHARGKRDTPSPGAGPAWFMREESVVMEDGLGMSERQSVRCWKAQGLSHESADCSVAVPPGLASPQLSTPAWLLSR